MPTVPGTSTGTAQAIIGLLAQDRARTQGNREAKNAQAQLLVNGILGGVNSAVGIGELVSGIVNARDRLALDQQEADRRIMADAQAAMQARYDRDERELSDRLRSDVERERTEVMRLQAENEATRFQESQRLKALEFMSELGVLGGGYSSINPAWTNKIAAAVAAATDNPALVSNLIDLMGQERMARERLAAAGIADASSASAEDYLNAYLRDDSIRDIEGVEDIIRQGAKDAPESLTNQGYADILRLIGKDPNKLDQERAAKLEKIGVKEDPTGSLLDYLHWGKGDGGFGDWRLNWNLQGGPDIQTSGVPFGFNKLATNTGFGLIRLFSGGEPKTSPGSGNPITGYTPSTTPNVTPTPGASGPPPDVGGALRALGASAGAIADPVVRDVGSAAGTVAGSANPGAMAAGQLAAKTADFLGRVSGNPATTALGPLLQPGGGTLPIPPAAQQSPADLFRRGALYRKMGGLPPNRAADPRAEALMRILSGQQPVFDLIGPNEFP